MIRKLQHQFQCITKVTKATRVFNGVAMGRYYLNCGGFADSTKFQRLTKARAAHDMSQPGTIYQVTLPGQELK